MKMCLFLVMLSITACSTTGDQSWQQNSINKNNVDKVLAKGTPQSKVLEALGSPNTNRSSTSHNSTLIIYFDKAKKVANHSFRSEIY